MFFPDDVFPSCRGVWAVQRSTSSRGSDPRAARGVVTLEQMGRGQPKDLMGGKGRKQMGRGKPQDLKL